MKLKPGLRVCHKPVPDDIATWEWGTVVKVSAHNHMVWVILDHERHPHALYRNRLHPEWETASDRRTPE